MKEQIVSEVSIEANDDDKPPPISNAGCNRMGISDHSNSSLRQRASYFSIFTSACRDYVGLVGIPSVCGWK